ncbi:hypothetical protein D5086_028621 [Populus alba]|uniref:Uncharacterized protein n=1 Tax=Populus alba TaxID=43335 RepID=A0ACC4AS08_POPAL
MKEPETIMFLILDTSHGSSSGSTATTTSVIVEKDNVVNWTELKGKVSRVSAHQVESYRAQERDERRELPQSSSTRVLHIQGCTTFKRGTILVEGDMVGKATMDLIPFLNMRKLVLGTFKSINPRHIITYLGSKGNGIADKNFKMHSSPMTLRSHAMKRIEVMNDQMIGSSSPLDNHSAMSTGLQDQSKTNNDSSA